MRFHKEGYTSLALCVLIIFVINALIQFYHPTEHKLMWMVYILSFVFFVAVLIFYRNPSVDVITDDNLVLSPADGMVVSIDETDFMNERRIKVSVAIGFTNVHVNRNPVKGVVRSVAKDDGTIIEVQNKAGINIIYKQVPGAFPKRVITYVKPGDEVEQGKQFGFSLTGAQVDVFLPTGTQINVQLNEAVAGGVTALARLT